MSVVGIRAHTPEDLLKMPDGDRYELVNGDLVECNTGFLSSFVGARLIRLMDVCCQLDQLGWLLGPDCGYQCFPDDPSKVRKPDVSFIALARLSGNPLPGAFVRIAPDLAAEVLSPNDLDWETDQRVEDLLRAGVRLVWVINPQSRTVLVYRADGTIVGLREHDQLSGEDVLPGFTCRVSDLFVLPGSAAS